MSAIPVMSPAPITSTQSAKAARPARHTSQEFMIGQNASRSVLRDSCNSSPADRTAINRANSQHSTGPRTEAGKQRSSQNALRHGLTAASPVVPSEDRAAYENHRRQFFDDQPATPTETQLVQELIDASWRASTASRCSKPTCSPAPPPPSR